MRTERPTPLTSLTGSLDPVGRLPSYNLPLERLSGQEGPRVPTEAELAHSLRQCGSDQPQS